MADIFGNTGGRGCFMVARRDAIESIGASLDLPGWGAIPSGYADPFLVTSFSLQRHEMITHNKTFGGRIYSYAFGHDPNTSILDVSLTAFLGAGGGLNPLDIAGAAYTVSRVSNSLDVGKFTLGGSTAVAGYVVGYSSSTIDPEHGLQDFSVRLALTSEW